MASSRSTRTTPGPKTLEEEISQTRSAASQNSRSALSMQTEAANRGSTAQRAVKIRFRLILF